MESRRQMLTTVDSGKPTLFSVIVPTFNAESTISEAIESLLSQTYTNLEVIVVDDCSEDGTVRCVKEKVSADPRVRLVTMAVNGGPSRARNAGIREARGDWIALLDADDTWAADRLETLERRLHEADFVADNILAYDDHLKTITGLFYAHRYRSDALTLSALMKFSQNFDFGYLKPAMRRSFLDAHALRYQEDVRHGEDLILYGSALCRKARFVLIDYAGYVYTTPLGMVSGAVSAHSKTVPSGTLLAEHVADLERQLGSGALPDDAQAIRRRARDIRGVLVLRRFLDAIRRGEGVAAARAAWADPYIFYMIVRYILPDKLARLMFKPDHVFAI